MKPYSKEFRGQVLAACDKGRSTREVATYFDVSESWVRRIKQERRELNKTAPLLKRLGLTVKKKSLSPRSGSGRTSRRGGKSCSGSSRWSIRIGSSSSTKRGPKRI